MGIIAVVVDGILLFPVTDIRLGICSLLVNNTLFDRQVLKFLTSSDFA